MSWAWRRSPLRHASSRNVTAFGHDHALVLAAWYRWDSLAARLLLKLGDWRGQRCGAGSSWRCRHAASGLSTCGWPRARLLLYLLLFDYHGALDCSSASVARHRTLLSLWVFSRSGACILTAGLFRHIRLQS